MAENAWPTGASTNALPTHVVATGTTVDLIHGAVGSVPLRDADALYQLMLDVHIGEKRFALLGQRMLWCAASSNKPDFICPFRESLLKPDEFGQPHVVWERLHHTFATRLEATRSFEVVDLFALSDAERVSHPYLSGSERGVVKESSDFANSVVAAGACGIRYPSVRSPGHEAFAIRLYERTLGAWRIVSSEAIADNVHHMQLIREEVERTGGPLP